MSSCNDHINVLPSEVNPNEGGSNRYVIREWARDLHIDGFNPQQGDTLVFDTSLGIMSQEQLANLITNIQINANNFIVNFGNDVTITLAGVQPDQIGWDNVVVGDPTATDPTATDPTATDPTATDPTATDPSATDPSATDPTATDPTATDPTATDPTATDPTATDPTATDPTATDPTATDPTATDPTATDPTATDPTATDPTATDPTATDPTATDPTATDPTATDPTATDPTATDPTTTDPTTTDPTATDPTATDPTATDPTTTDPTTTDPIATDPTTTDPVAAGPDQNIDCNPGESVQGDDGSDNFVFHDLGNWTINNFNASEDTLDFTEYGITQEQLASYITNIQINADNFIVNFGDNVSITLVGQSPTWDNVTTVEG